MNIELRQIKEACNRLLDHAIAQSEGGRLPLDQDFYWHVPCESKYGSDTPSELDIGSLFSDLETTLTMLDDEYEPVTALLSELAPVLSYIGETLE